MGEPVGFVGLGIMGSRMAANLARAGHDVAVYNRTAEKAQAWVEEHGGRFAATPRDAAEGAAAVITMVVDGPQVEAMLLGEDGAVAGARERTLFVDMSTIAPATAGGLAETISARGHAFVDAPVTGSSPKAEAGTLTIMCGGAEADVERAREYAESSPSIVTPLNRYLGYEEAASIAKQSLKERKTIRDVVIERGHVEDGKLSMEQLDAALDVLAMARGGKR